MALNAMIYLAKGRGILLFHAAFRTHKQCACAPSPHLAKLRSALPALVPIRIDDGTCSSTGQSRLKRDPGGSNYASAGMSSGNHLLLEGASHFTTSQD